MLSNAFERLNAAFDDLDGIGIIGRHFPADGRSDAHALIDAEITVARREGKTYRGYCFYDQFGVERSSEGVIFLNFGSADTRPTYAALWREQVEIGKSVFGALRARGLNAQWDGGPNDVIWIVGEKWKLPRDKTLVPIGPRRELGKVNVLADLVADLSDKPQAPAAKNVSICCPAGSADGHRLVEAIHRATGGDIYCALERSADQAAAAAVSADGVLLDFVAPACPANAMAMLRARDLVNESDFLVQIAARRLEPPAFGEPFWQSFTPDRRLSVVVDGTAPAESKDGSRVHAVDLESGRGVGDLIGIVRSALYPS